MTGSWPTGPVNGTLAPQKTAGKISSGHSLNLALRVDEPPKLRVETVQPRHPHVIGVFKPIHGMVGRYMELPPNEIALASLSPPSHRP